ncbi:hypothetical protein BDN70DRAFT_819223, partial [Pholiota conissans]
METEDAAIARIIHRHVRYAILSHTWLRESPGEVTYAHWMKRLFNEDDDGYHKLVNFCTTASKHHHLTLGWMDTICINKDSSSELDESIRSMYKWYERADVCIVHLAGTQSLQDMHLDPWFTRGWTLQEMLAPEHMKFCNKNWKYFFSDASSNDKYMTARDDVESFGPRQIMRQINKATTITQDELQHIVSIPLSRRMQLAASRKVTREEDMAYSLMGVFGVSITTAYGEGSDRAFLRLLEAVLNTTSLGVLDLLNWAG